jgi:fimbrial chaperone protein
MGGLFAGLKRRFPVGVILLSIAMPGPLIAAASLLIWPMDPIIEADRGASALWLENRGNTPAVLQIRILAWAQRGGKDDYGDQAAIVASPPMVQIPPGKRQLVRLTSIQKQRAAGETAFRIIIEEIPVAASDESGEPRSSAVRFRMRYSLPLFVYGGDFRTAASRARPPPLRCAIMEQDGREFVRIENVGTLHARLTNVRFEGDRSPIPLAEGLLGYVLPGNAMRWELPPGVSGQEPLSMAVNGGATQVTLHCSGA